MVCDFIYLPAHHVSILQTLVVRTCLEQEDGYILVLGEPAGNDTASRPTTVSPIKCQQRPASCCPYMKWACPLCLGG